MSTKCPRPPRGDDAEDLADFLEQVERQLTLVGSRTIDVLNVPGGTVATFTIEVIGCKVGFQQAVALSPPPAIEANLLWCGFVTADDEVTVRLYNHSGGDIDPASGVWGARVFL